MTSKTEIERLRREHALLIESIEVTPMPFAVYDEEDRLIAWNEPYERLHAHAFRKLAHKANGNQLFYADLVRVSAEQILPPDQVEDYVNLRVEQQRRADGTGVDREYAGHGWYRVSKCRTPSGAVVGFAIDISEIKNREAGLEEEVRRREVLEEKLRYQVSTDMLTGLSNRGAFLERARVDFRRAQRYGIDLSTIMMDIDEFKKVNDTYGHGVGDAVIAKAAATAAAMLRKDVDLIGRVGGEEFAVVMPHSNTEAAVSCAERMRLAIAALQFDGGGTPFCVTASFGVTGMTGQDGDYSAMLNRADRALYDAKNRGRNRVACR